jgi:hypothetical protein
MKVRELIEKLQALDPEAEVVSPQGEHGDLESIDFVGYEPSESGEIVTLDSSDWRWQCRCPEPFKEKSQAQKILEEVMVRDMTRFAIGWLQKANKQYENLEASPGEMKISMPKIGKPS